MADQPPSDDSGTSNGSGSPGGQGQGGRGNRAGPSTEGPASPTSPAGKAPADANGKNPPAHGKGNPDDASAGGGAGSHSPREQVLQELMADLRDETRDARTVLVGPEAREVLEDLHPDIHSPHRPENVSVVASFERVRGPLDHLITLLQAELERSQRQHELTDQTQEKAPLAYGDAVADYFEQLSHDYQPGATPVPGTPPESTPSP